MSMTQTCTKCMEEKQYIMWADTYECERNQLTICCDGFSELIHQRQLEEENANYK